MAFGDSQAVREVYEAQLALVQEQHDAARARMARSGEFLSMARQAYEADEREFRQVRERLDALEDDMEREFGD